MHAIEIDRLTRIYGSVRAVDGVSFHVESGEIFGFMGHNGAGKTTTLRMLLGLTRPTSGSARVLGHDVVRESLEVRRQCGFLPASYALPAHMTARQFLHYIAAMFDLEADVAEARIQSLLQLFGIQAAADRKLGGFSTGMTQKVGLAQALINEPRIVLLDEPTSGLDPLGRYELLEHLRHLSSERGVTVLFSSHILSDIETLCRRVAALHQGRLVAFGPIEALKSEYRSSNMDELYLSLARRAA
ncbi:ABC transporter ATP-binding protein [Archangium violaceum]|uniref:ABC transporter ATP-binding protein n=1 Tax=Archangium violaceum TaxID=83451 RepID=UPI00193C1FF3|nr:ABC transporter ATP-binding protein [Archangium violaceum]QRK06329.1 ABC transporter ATP-binding protein [Archangium violaceum]